MPSDLGHGIAHGAPQPREAEYSSDVDEGQPLTQDDGGREYSALHDDAQTSAAASLLPAPLRPSLALRLYASHLLSTWNSRVFEFGAVLFLAALYPRTLRPLSVYALARGAAAVLGARAVGAAIDARDRLAVVRASIVGQRAAVAASCGLFWAMHRRLHGHGGEDGDGGDGVAGGLFVLVVLLACVEKLCAVMNLVAVERDWVVVITEGNEALRHTLNARMRRIDLLCKLLGPLVISSISLASTLVAIQATLAMNVVSVLIEYVCIKQVYQQIPALKRTPASAAAGETAGQDRDAPAGVVPWLKAAGSRILPLDSLPLYLGHPALRPSLSLSLLYLTVLSFSGQMLTYLLSVGYTPLHVGAARTASTVFELSATWAAPALMRRVGPVRGGIWGLSWQMAWLAAGVAWFLSPSSGARGGAAGPDGDVDVFVAATGLAVCVAFSRVGLWGFDLCAQTIVQDEVQSEHRGAFSTMEAAFQNLFEMASFAITVVFSRPDQFKWPVLVSVAAVYLAGGLYASFVRRRRGHLFHAPKCVCTQPGL